MVKFVRSLLILSAKSLFDQKSTSKTISKRFEFPGPWAAHEFFKLESLVQPGLFDRYAARPQEDEFEKMTLAHFSVWYDSIYRDDTPKGSSGRHIQPQFKLQGNLGWIKLRTKQACLRTPIMTPQSHGDEYYYSLLLLYIPWRREKKDLLLKHDSALSAFIAREKEMKVLNCEHHTFAEEVQRAVQQLQAVSDGAYMNLVAPNVQHGEREDATHVPEELDHGLHNAENYVQDEQVDVDALPTVADDDNANGALTRMCLTDKTFTELVCNLNAKQRDACRTCPFALKWLPKSAILLATKLLSFLLAQIKMDS